MFGEFAREEEAHGGLNFSRGDGGALVVLGQAGGLVCHALEEVSDERVHDRHRLGGNTCIRVHLKLEFCKQETITIWSNYQMF